MIMNYYQMINYDNTEISSDEENIFDNSDVLILGSI